MPIYFGNTKTVEIKIEKGDSNRRLDKFLFQYLNNAPHSFIYKMLRKKRIKLNNSRAQGNEILAQGDKIKFYFSDETLESCKKMRVVAIAKPLTSNNIVFENDDILIVDKPAGLPSHGGMGNNYHLLARILYYLRETGAFEPTATFTPALCNRLDVNTSGLVVCGKNIHALQAVNNLFSTRKIDKEYLTIVEGVIGAVGEMKTLEGYYQKDSHTNKAYIGKKETGMLAITIYKVLAISKSKKYSLVSVMPVTGRSHQIRAHFASISFPLAGDKKYGGSPTPFAPTQLLHCKRLTPIAEELPSFPFPFPEVTTPPPKNFLTCLQNLFNYSL